MGFSTVTRISVGMVAWNSTNKCTADTSRSDRPNTSVPLVHYITDTVKELRAIGPVCDSRATLLLFTYR